MFAQLTTAGGARYDAEGCIATADIGACKAVALIGGAAAR